MTNQNDNRSLVLSLERALLNTPTRQDPNFLQATLADEFKEFGKSGRIYDKSAIVAALTGESDIERSAVERLVMSNVQVTSLAADVVLLTYTLSSAEGQSSALRSSIWKRHLQTWLLVFHQGTPLAPA